MVEGIITAVVDFVKCFAPTTQRQLSYLSNYSSNVEKLKAEVEKLKCENASIQHKVVEAKDKGEEIEQNVQKWLESAKETTDEAEKFIADEQETAAKKRCFKVSCPKLKTRYQLSKKAAAYVKDIVELREEAAGRFHRVSYRTTPEDIKLTTSKDYEAFESRMPILKNVLGALRNPDVNMIGIYGMGGIGKTTLAQEVAAQAKKDKLFDRVVFAEISQNPDIKKIQGEIADKLGLSFVEESESGRAGRLRERLKKEEGILVILDNVWENLDLEAVGIPLGDDHKGCKVLLTARSEDLLSRKMDSQRNFPIRILNKQEAWSLFKKMAGDYVEDPEFKPVATEVAEECAGLPIALVSVARALRKQKLFDWMDALEKLRTPSSINFKDVQPKAYSAIKLSYDKLEGEELKKIFVLIAYTYITSFDDLLMYGMGLGLFQGIKKMEAAQDRVRASVNKLKASCVLLDGIWGQDFSMHDVVRDVAISIASTDHHVFTARNEVINQWEWLDEEKILKGYTSIVLLDAKMNSELPQVLECPQLKLFYMRAEDSNLPCSYFARMIELRVLHLSSMYLIPLPSSLGSLENLRTLCLHSCKLKDMAVIGGLKKLEILSFRDAEIEQLPVEISQLTWLRSLDLTNCEKLKIIPPNVILSFSHLEELYMGNSFDEWELEGLNNNERRNVSLNELKHLSNLTCLEIQIRDAKALAINLFSKLKLKRYKIVIGDRWWWDNTLRESSRKFKLDLKDANICFNDEHIMQLKGIEDLYLAGLRVVKNIVYELDREGFSKLKRLHVRRCNLLRIVDSMDCQLTPESFSRLRIIKVENCNELRNIFSFHIARGLQQLQSIEVGGCSNMEEIFAIGRSEDESQNSEVIQNIELNQLLSLRLESLPQLKNFCSRVKSPSTQSNEIILEDSINVSRTLFNEKVVLPNMTFLELMDVYIGRIWQNQIAAMTCGTQNLTMLIVSGCRHLKYVFPSLNSGSFVQLQHLEIKKCPVLEEIVTADELRREIRSNVLFPKLDSLEMEDLENLKRFCPGDYIEFPSLKELKIMSCPKLKTFITESTSKDMITAGEDIEKISSVEISSPLFNEKVAFPSLEQIRITNNDNIKTIWHHQLPEENFAFKLKLVEVKGCVKLETLFPRTMYRKFLRLEELMISNCESLEVIFDLEGVNFEETRCAVTPLQDLDISGLPKLKHVWKKDPKKILNFQKLKKVKVYKCDRLKYVFPASVARSFNSVLEMLSIRSCGLLEEIIHVADHQLAEAKTPRFVFERVSHLTLSDLPKLGTFFRGIQTIKWPMLKKLVCGCDLVKIFSPELHKESQPDIPAQPPRFLVEKGLPNLEELVVQGKGMTTIWQFPKDFLSKLRRLEVHFDESNVVLSLDFLKRFRSMKALQLNGLLLRYGVVENEESALIRNLNTCYDLKHILKEVSDMDNLVHLQVYRCYNLINVLPSSKSFQNLTTLNVRHCKGLINVVTSSTATSLGRLREMKISICNTITEIVADDEKDDASKDHEIVFKELEKLWLFNLKRLTSFCSGNAIFKFPCLKELIVSGCPKMKIFCKGELSTPKLQKVKKTLCKDLGRWNGDLNATITQLHEEMKLRSSKQEISLFSE